MSIKHSLKTCLKQTEQVENEIHDLGIESATSAKLSTLLQTAKDALAIAFVPSIPKNRSINNYYT